MMFSTLLPLQRAALILLTQILCYSCVLIVIRRTFRRNSLIIMMEAFFPAAFSFCLQIIMIREHISEGKESRISLPFLLTALLLLMIYILVYLTVTAPRENRMISMESIIESFDSVSTGICFYWPEGLVKLVNREMNEISLAMTGTLLTDGKSFWDRLSRLKPYGEDGPLQPIEEKICRLENGTVYSFRRIPVDLSGHLIYELTASDITEEYTIGRVLKEKQEKADAINKRLVQLSETIAQMSAERELLDARIRLHDGIGQILLMMRAYINDPSSADGKQLASASRTMVRLLQEPGREPADLLTACRRKAAELGVSLELIGDLPQEKAYTEVLQTAIMTSVLNIRQHADGDRLLICSELREGAYHICFTNNGKPPSTEIRESGGLKNLRKKVEKAGGSMQIRSVPRMELSVVLPLP